MARIVQTDSKRFSLSRHVLSDRSRPLARRCVTRCFTERTNGSFLFFLLFYMIYSQLLSPPPRPPLHSHPSTFFLFLPWAFDLTPRGLSLPRPSFKRLSFRHVRFSPPPPPPPPPRPPPPHPAPLQTPTHLSQLYPTAGVKFTCYFVALLRTFMIFLKLLFGGGWVFLLLLLLFVAFSRGSFYVFIIAGQRM